MEGLVPDDALPVAVVSGCTPAPGELMSLPRTSCSRERPRRSPGHAQPTSQAGRDIVSVARHAEGETDDVRRARPAVPLDLDDTALLRTCGSRYRRIVRNPRELRETVVRVGGRPEEPALVCDGAGEGLRRESRGSRAAVTSHPDAGVGRAVGPQPNRSTTLAPPPGCRRLTPDGAPAGPPRRLPRCPRAAGRPRDHVYGSPGLGAAAAAAATVLLPAGTEDPSAVNDEHGPRRTS